VLYACILIGNLQERKTERAEWGIWGIWKRRLHAVAALAEIRVFIIKFFNQTKKRSSGQHWIDCIQRNICAHYAFSLQADICRYTVYHTRISRSQSPCYKQERQGSKYAASKSQFCLFSLVSKTYECQKWSDELKKHHHGAWLLLLAQ